MAMRTSTAYTITVMDLYYNYAGLPLQIVESSSGVRTNLTPACKDWCRNTLGYIPDIRRVDFPAVLKFRSDADAVYFSLMWR